MSRETANAARYAKGLCVLSELESEMLEALEGMVAVAKADLWREATTGRQIIYRQAVAAIRASRGNP